MINAGVKDVKNNLSRYLAHVKEGEEIIITERGKPVARIVKENQGNKSLRAALSPLIEKGMVRLPDGKLNKDRVVPREVSGKLVSEMVIENRR